MKVKRCLPPCCPFPPLGHTTFCAVLRSFTPASTTNVLKGHVFITYDQLDTGEHFSNLGSGWAEHLDQTADLPCSAWSEEPQ